jgi:hypothetical protein
MALRGSDTDLPAVGKSRLSHALQHQNKNAPLLSRASHRSNVLSSYWFLAPQQKRLFLSLFVSLHGIQKLFRVESQFPQYRGFDYFLVQDPLRLETTISVP